MTFALPVLAILAAPSEHFRTRPVDYPLPMTADGVPYWVLNTALIHVVQGWRDWQAHKPMDAIIPVIKQAMAGVTA